MDVFRQSIRSKNGLKKKEIWIEINRHNFPTKFIEMGTSKITLLFWKRNNLLLISCILPSETEPPSLAQCGACEESWASESFGTKKRLGNCYLVANLWKLLDTVGGSAIQQSALKKMWKPVVKKWEKRSNELFSWISSIKRINWLLNHLLLEFHIKNSIITFHAVPSTVLRSANKTPMGGNMAYHDMMSKFQ